MAYELFNGDGTRFDPPEIEPYKQMVEQRFPRCKAYGYQCMFCDKCPSGEYFKWPSDCNEILEAQNLAVNHYINSHNTMGTNSMYLKEE